MLSLQDFTKKQIIFILFNQGEKLSFSNENLVVKDKDKKIKLQTSCYNIYIIFAIGNFSITSPLIEKSRKYGFFIILMSSSLKVYDIIGSVKNGNTLLKKRQYLYSEIDIAKHITKNKIQKQYQTVLDIRNKNELQREILSHLTKYISNIDKCINIQEIMGYEGMASKMYFNSYFDNVLWKGRKPRIKSDFVNSTLDIGYTMLFNFIEAILYEKIFSL